MREIKFTNSMTGKKEVFQPIEPGKARLYACGPTVYNFIHIGNLRAALFSDLVYRYLSRAGYAVTFVRNYTDVDDKIITKSNEEKTTALAVADRYVKEVELDYAAAGLREPTHKPRVTQTMPEIVDMIEKLIDRGHAYVVDGEVLYSIDSFKEYGKLSKKPLEDLQAGIRVEVNSKKKNPLDFTLWKPAKPGEPSWESPWGKGRPGWHIECSAMAKKCLGDRIDLHLGGEDLIFPHHENEIAQSEGANGVAPFSGMWLHNAFVTMSQEKMSKSLGNVFLARDFLKKYSGEVARYLLLSVHYRSLLDFSQDSLEHALTALHRIYEAKQKAFDLVQGKVGLPDPRAEIAWGEFIASSEKAKEEIDEAYANDLNTAGALGALFTLIREFNRMLAVPHATQTPAGILAGQALISIIENDIGSVIGIGRLRPEKMFEDLNRIRAEASGKARPSEDEIVALIEARKAARAAKDFAKSDQIRNDLLARGVVLKDSPAGTTWEYQ